MLPVILLDMVGWGLAFCPLVTSTNARPPSMWTCERFWGPHNILPWVFASSFQQGCRDNWQWTFGTMDCKTVETTWIGLSRTMECFYSVGKRIYSKANCIIERVHGACCGVHLHRTHNMCFIFSFFCLSWIPWLNLQLLQAEVIGNGTGPSDEVKIWKPCFSFLLLRWPTHSNASFLPLPRLNH